MEWFILFIISWILFFLTVDWKMFKYNLWCGIMAMVIQLTVDYHFIEHNFYIINNTIKIFNSSIFFVLGPVFIAGTLIAQYHPVKRLSTIINLIVFTALFSAEEYLLEKTKALEYINWDFFDSIIINLLAIGLLSWFTIVILQNGRKDNV